MAILEINIPKAGTTMLVDTNDLPDTMFNSPWKRAKALLNSRMSKIVGVTTLAGDELAKAQAAARIIRAPP